MAPQRKTATAARRMIWKPSHPLATKNGYVSEARMLLYDAIGDGPHRCHWCGVEVDWIVLQGRGTTARGIVADHKDGDWRNNMLANLACACQGCNGTRWHRVGDAERFVLVSGRRLRAIELRCESCGTLFLRPPSMKKAGRFCSLACYRRRRPVTPP